LPKGTSIEAHGPCRCPAWPSTGRARWVMESRTSERAPDQQLCSRHGS